MSGNSNKSASIAIVGMGCRFPGAPNVDAYWQLLLNGVDAVREVPPNRWNVDQFHDPAPATPCKTVSRCGGFLDDIDGFDPYFFGISPREAIRLDPQQRLLLECTWHAMEHAGLRREQFVGSRTGVFIGVCTDDYITLERGDLRNIDIYMGTGGSRGSTAGRLAFAYGLRGPVAAIDTACSSSLVAVHQACNSLQLGDCEMAIAGGVNVVLHPGTAIAFSQANMLSPDGRCKAFDARANGFVRSEGAGVVLLKPLEQALADGDPIYAVIRGTASNNDGSTSPFMTPSRIGQAALLRDAYDRAQVDPRTVHYVEAHGTGTEVGDPVEMGALDDVLGQGRSAGETCTVGSSKTNIGHLEAAAGIAGLIKTTLVLQHGIIPPNLHFETPNPNIPWRDIPFRVPVAPVAWSDSQDRIAAVNSFGISGTNAHVILEAPRRAGTPRAASSARSGMLLITAHARDSLQAMAMAWRDRLRESSDDALADLCLTACRHLTHHEHRVAIAGTSRTDITAKLDGWISGELPEGVFTEISDTGSTPRPAFVFSGIGTQWAGMGLQLMREDGVFREALEQCDAAIRVHTGWSVREELARPQVESRLSRIDIMQPCIFSIQVATAALWQHWGAQPAAIVGHSLGEIAAAHVAGALSLEDAVRVVCERSRLMHRVSGLGAMAAVGLSAGHARDFLSEHGMAGVTVAVVNAPDACTVSGDLEAIHTVAKALDSNGVFCKVLNVNVACHSHHMQPLASELRTVLQGILPRPARVPLYSSLTGARVDGAELTPEYWARNLEEPVAFADAATALLTDEHRVFLEVSPTPALMRPLQQNARHHGRSIVTAASLRANADERSAMLESLAQLSTHGCPFDWTHIFQGGKFVAPPAYVWPRERYWFEDEGAATHRWSTGTGGAHATGHPLLGAHWQPADEPATHCFEGQLDLRSTRWLNDHRAEGMPLFPAAAYVELALAASMHVFPAGPRTLRDIKLHKALFLTDEPTSIQLVLRQGHARQSHKVATALSTAERATLSFACFARKAGDVDEPGWTLVAEGRMDLSAQERPPRLRTPDVVATKSVHYTVRSAQEFYATVRTGLTFGELFQGVQKCWTAAGAKRAITYVSAHPAIASDARSYRVHPALLDMSFHSLFGTARDNDKLSLPYGIETCMIFALPDASRPHWCEVVTERTEGGHRSQITLADEQGECLVRVEGYLTRLLDHTAAQDSDSTDWLYEVEWKEATRSGAAAIGNTPWLVLSTTNGQVLADVLKAHGIPATWEAPGDTVDDVSAQLTHHQGCEALVYLAGRVEDADMPSGNDVVDAAYASTRELFTLLQACARHTWTSPPRVFVVTSNGRNTSDSDAADLDLARTPLGALARVAAIEHRELRITQIDVDRSTTIDELALELVSADNEQEVALRHGTRLVPRLARLNAADRLVDRHIVVQDASRDGWRLESAGTGVLDDLALHYEARRPPGPREVEVRIQAVALNFLDVLKALNMAPGLPEGARFYGMECAGKIVAVGSGVTHLAPGDEVLALDTTARGCFRAYLTLPASSVIPIPASLGVEDAVTIPVAYQTAYYALCELGRIRAGESVLIHSAAGGVGLAALQVALSRGATVYATAGTDEKRAFLKERGAHHVMNSRTLEFAHEVRELTGGRGVDLVLNSLAGEAIPASLELLATGGRFLEIGKRDIYADSQIGLLPFQRNLSFFAIDLLRMRMEKPDVVEELTAKIAAQIHAGSFVPLPRTTFSITDVSDAFRYMTKGTHTGKIVVRLDAPALHVKYSPPPMSVGGEGTYLITGGLGALGLAFARQLAAQGARHLALVGRRAPSVDALHVIDQLRASGVRVSVDAADVADNAELGRLLEHIHQSGAPLRGVLHAAGITDDRTLMQLTWEQFESVFAAKVKGAWNLHTLLAHTPLDFMVFFSSAAAVLGGGGQANYAAANAFLDALASYRRRQGLPALSVNWGPWADIGMAAIDDSRGARLAAHGMESIPVRDGTALLDVLVQQRPAQVAVMPVNWEVWATHFPEATRAPFLELLAGEWNVGDRGESESDISVAIRSAAGTSEATSLLVDHLGVDVARLLRVPADRFNPRVSLIRFGLDSLMAIELRNRVEGQFGVVIPPARLLQGPSVVELAEWLVSELRSAMPAPAASPATGTFTAATASDVDAMSDDDVNLLLEQMLTSNKAADVN